MRFGKIVWRMRICSVDREVWVRPLVPVFLPRLSIAFILLRAMMLVTSAKAAVLLMSSVVLISTSLMLPAIIVWRIYAS